MSAQPADLTPFERLGGADAVRALVDQFYDHMQANPAFAELRALHAPDLTPMRESLSGFLNGWLGGPRDWFAARPGVCMMSAHAAVPVTHETAVQWLQAMAQALRDRQVESSLAAEILDAFGRMAANMAARG